MDLPIERSDLRNMSVVVAIVTLVMLVFLDGPVPARLLGGLVLGGISALSFVLVTVLINAVKPDHW